MRAQLTKTTGNGAQIHPLHRPPPRPRAGAAHKSRDEDGRRRPAPRDGGQGAERGEGVGCRTRGAGQGGQEDADGRADGGQGAYTDGMLLRWTRVMLGREC